MAKSFLFHFNIFEAIFSNTACLLIRYLLSSELFIFYTTVFCFFYILCVFSWASCKSAWGEKKCITGNLKFNQMAVKKFAQTDATNSANLITGTWTDATFKNLWYLFFREHWQELHHHKTHTHTLHINCNGKWQDNKANPGHRWKLYRFNNETIDNHASCPSGKKSLFLQALF